MKRRWRWLGFVAALIILHGVLLPIFAQEHIVASLLGGSGEAWRLGIAVLFIVTRLCVLLLVPGIVLAHVGILVYDALRRSSKPPQK